MQSSLEEYKGSQGSAGSKNGGKAPGHPGSSPNQQSNQQSKLKFKAKSQLTNAGQKRKYTQATPTSATKN